MTAPLCSLCTQQHLHQTASGAWICPICDRNVPHQPTRKDS